MATTVLVVDDEESIIQSLGGILTDEGLEVVSATSGAEALEKIDEMMPDLVLLDIWMPGMDGIETLIKIKESYPHLQVVMMSGHGTIETAVKATKLGAYDFIEKPLSLEKVILSITNALEHYRLEEEITLLKEKQKNKYRITGHSPAIRQLKEQIHIVAPTNAWVLISGENGTGKELVAHTIHQLSKRSHKPLVEVNCAAIPEELIESELFGHEKGAFTGATVMKKGKFDLAHQGTLFLDEIGDMSLKAQSKTLRILQEQKFERVGGSRTIQVDVRVIAATNKDLEAEIEKGTFRDDLYFRLNVIPIRVPPLRERTEDIPELVGEFLREISLDTNLEPKEFSEDAIKTLQKYHWPGNVRELKNLVERLVIMIPGKKIRAQDIPPPFNQESAVEGELASSLMAKTYREAKGNFERAFIAKKLREFNWNISQTADAIGIERSNLHKKIKAYGLDNPRSE
ncbi:MAG: sigma-54-dependent Fis family transcriptional regulator [Deltaproteobacteria bacterium]|nr:sigma-54-dependent Fis family transcriptional regulator [Deltaproteobacteria bacterium]RLB31689.1 MAG: sigma-54-dependent Fis family transcriptional regulator [Deltaproteobacteria bacterium]